MEGQTIRKDSRFLLQPQDVVLESFADETVAVHLGTGRYFSIDTIGAEVIELLQTGNDVSAVVADCVTTRHDADPQMVDDAVVEFVGRLVEEGLIRSAATGTRARRSPGGCARPIRSRPDHHRVHRHGGSLAARPHPRRRRDGLARATQTRQKATHGASHDPE